MIVAAPILTSLLPLVRLQEELPDGGLTLHEVVESLPTDPLSLVTLTLTLFATGAVIYFGRKSPPPTPRKEDPS